MLKRLYVASVLCAATLLAGLVFVGVAHRVPLTELRNITAAGTGVAQRPISASPILAEPAAQFSSREPASDPSVPEPHKVKTVMIRPDGPIVGDSQSQLTAIGAEAAQEAAERALAVAALEARSSSTTVSLADREPEHLVVLNQAISIAQNLKSQEDVRRDIAENRASTGIYKPSGPLATIEDITAEAERQLRIVSSQYKVPDKLLYGRSSEVVFVLETQGPGSATALLAAAPGTAVSALVKASNVVHAKLTGPPDMVSIKLRGGDSGERQTVTALAPIEWIWDVTGLDTGSVDLQLQLLSEVKLEDKPETVQIKTFEKTLPIEIRSVDRLKRFLDGWTPIISPMWAALTTALTAFAGALAYLGWRGNKPSKSSGD